MVTQNWNTRPNKHNNDEELYSIIRQCIPTEGTHNVLCLPGYTFRWEEELTRQNTLRHWEFYGLQPDRNYRETLTKNAYTLNHVYKEQGIATRYHSFPNSNNTNLRFENFVGFTDKTFSIIYADWMGGWYGVPQNGIATVFRRNVINNGGLLIFTVQIKCARSEPKTNGFHDLCVYYNTNKLPPKDAKLDILTEPSLTAGAHSIDNIVKGLGNRHKYDLTLAHFGRYKGDKNKEDMFTFSYTCNKQK